MAGARRVLVVGYFGFGNLGDDAILDATLAGLRRACSPPPEVVLVAGEPASAAARFGVSAVHWQDVDAIAETVRSVDLVVIGGGGLFQDWWGVDPDLLLDPRHWGMALYAGPAILAAAMGRPVALHALGVGPLGSEPARRLAKAASDAAVSVVVRDEGSRALLEACGVEPGRIAVAADPAFALNAQPGTDAGEWREALGGHRGPLVAAALRPWTVAENGPDWEGEVARGLDLVIERHGAAVVLVPLQPVHHEWPPGYRSDTDVDVAGRVREAMRHHQRAVIAGTPGTAGEAAALLGACDAVLAMRLHAAVLAAIAGTPSAALAYDPKVASCCEALGLGGLAVDPGSATAAGIADAVGTILGDDGELRRGLAERVAPLRDAAERGIDALARVVAEPPPAPGVLTPELAEHFERLIAAQMARAALGGGPRPGPGDAETALAEMRGRAASAEERAEALAGELARARRRHGELAARVEGLEEAARELERWRGSRLWRLASLYWAVLDRLPGRRGGR